MSSACPGPGSPAAIDWSAIHRRLERIGALLEEGALADAGARRGVLRARAVALAEGGAPAAAAASIPALVFALGGSNYVLDLRWIGEVARLRELTPLPGCPEHLAGICNLHGRILPILDLRRLLGLPSLGLTDLDKVVVLRGGGGDDLAFLADAFLQVGRLALDDLLPLPTALGGAAAFLTGVTRTGEVVLDGGKLLAALAGPIPSADLNEGEPPGRFAPSTSPLVPHV